MGSKSKTILPRSWLFLEHRTTPLRRLRLNCAAGLSTRGGSCGAGVVAPMFTCAVWRVARLRSTMTTPHVFPGAGLGAGSDGKSNATANINGDADGNCVAFSDSVPFKKHVLRTVRLHNMPRTWLHEEVIQFLHQVAEHAGIEPPQPTHSSAGGVCDGDTEGNDNASDGHEKQEEVEENEDTVTSAVPYVTSPFVARMHIPFGRRTGITYGSPIIQLTSNALAEYLLHDISFDSDDYRSRIYFTEVTKKASDDGGIASSSDEAEVLRAEQEKVLETLELDRYLLAPDLLYDIARMRQRRLVTRRSKLLLHTFADEEEHEKNKNNGEKDGNTVKKKTGETYGLKRGSSSRKSVLRCVGDYKEMGRGSMHSVPLAVPYVQGRRGT